MSTTRLFAIGTAFLIGSCPCHAEDLDEISATGHTCQPTAQVVIVQVQVIQAPTSPGCIFVKAVFGANAPTPRDMIIWAANQLLEKSQEKYGGARIAFR